MGGVGVVSANFLTAPFYNPALTAIYRRNDDLGMITPSFGLSYTDTGNFVDDLEKAEKQIKAGDYTGAQATLDQLKGDQLNVEMGGVVAFAIPNRFVAANAFGKLYTESFATTNIKTDGANETENALGSSVRAVSVGVAEAGLTLAKYQTFMGQHISFGITPKLQRVYTYVYEANLINYDLKDLRDNSKGETMFNMDAGFLWFYGPFRAGISATNLISRDIQTQSIKSIDGTNVSYAYEMSPQYTVGAGIVADYFTLSVDYDLKEQERYIGFDDNTQMLRVGAELDLLRQLKLRAGWKKNLAYDDTEGTYTAGIGLSPLNLFQMDIGASYTNENSMGGYVNFLTSY